jgi:hypothetical protein
MNGVQMALVENDDVASASERKGPYQPFGARSRAFPLLSSSFVLAITVTSIHLSIAL